MGPTRQYTLIQSCLCVDTTPDAILKIKFYTSETTKIRHFKIENSKFITPTTLPLGVSILVPSAHVTLSWISWKTVVQNVENINFYCILGFQLPVLFNGLINYVTSEIIYILDVGYLVCSFNTIHNTKTDCI